MAEVAVVGSINMDLVVKTKEIPKIGETILGEKLLQIPGGKGANQGVAVSKLGNNVVFLGKVGRDLFGDASLKSMKLAGVNTERVERTDDTTGIAVINVDMYGNNNIVVVTGANSQVDKDYLERNVDVFEKSKIVLFQLEIPRETVKEGLRIAKKLGKITILNPAPAQELGDEIISNVDILIPNEYELERISKVKVEDDCSMLGAAKVLINKGLKQIIVTLGSRGALYVNKNEHKFFNAYNVKAIDTTAAGDSFIGGFTSSYIKDFDIEKAIDMGQKTAALCIQKIGAQSSLPTAKDIQDFNWDTAE